MSIYPNWTKEELKILEEAYPRLGRCKELQELFPTRPLQGICLKANRMGYKVINDIHKARTNDEYLELLENTNFVVLEEYKGSTTPIMHMCGICEHEWLARPQAILRPNARCPICDTTWRKNSSLEKVHKILAAANMEQVSEYTGALDKITLKHTPCGYVWDTVYSYIEQGSGCPLCNVGFGYKYSKENLPEVARIYLFEIETKTQKFLKIGVSVRPIHRRQTELKSCIPDIVSIKLIHEFQDTGIKVLSKEKLILASFKSYVCLTKFAGSGELLRIDSDIDLIKKIMNENV